MSVIVFDQPSTPEDIIPSVNNGDILVIPYKRTRKAFRGAYNGLFSPCDDCPLLDLEYPIKGNRYRKACGAFAFKCNTDGFKEVPIETIAEDLL